MEIIKNLALSYMLDNMYKICFSVIPSTVEYGGFHPVYFLINEVDSKLSEEDKLSNQSNLIGRFFKEDISTKTGILWDMIRQLTCWKTGNLDEITICKCSSGLPHAIHNIDELYVDLDSVIKLHGLSWVEDNYLLCASSIDEIYQLEEIKYKKRIDYFTKLKDEKSRKDYFVKTVKYRKDPNYKEVILPCEIGMYIPGF